MSIDQDARRLMKFYPKVFFACHTRHVRDAKTDELVSAQQVRILEHLDDLDGTPLCTLAEHLGVTPSTLSLTVDRLERKGYVARQRGRGDRRQIMLRLTKAGLRIREAYTVLDRRRVRAVLEQLPSAARNQVLSALQTLAKAATTMMRDPRGHAPHGKKFSRGASP